MDATWAVILTSSALAHRRGVEAHPHNPCFGTRPLLEDGKTRGEYEWEDYKSVLAKVKDLASGLRRIDCNPVRRIFLRFLASQVA
jgi:hypothetical protein